MRLGKAIGYGLAGAIAVAGLTIAWRLRVSLRTAEAEMAIEPMAEPAAEPAVETGAVGAEAAGEPVQV